MRNYRALLLWLVILVGLALLLVLPWLARHAFVDNTIATSWLASPSACQARLALVRAEARGSALGWWRRGGGALTTPASRMMSAASSNGLNGFIGSPFAADCRRSRPEPPWLHDELQVHVQDALDAVGG
jgi:hypothetical protein